MRKIILALSLSALALVGCVKVGSGTPPSTAGVYKSFDKGTTWVTKNLFQYSNGIGNINGINVLALTFDPEDNRAIYLSSDASGLFYSYDGGDSWRKADAIGNTRIADVEVDPKNKCIIYVTSGSSILKTNDCSRTWSEVYVDTRKDKLITALAIDPRDSTVIFAGNTAGDILKSMNGGGEWRVIDRLNNQIMKILIVPTDSKTMYIATKSAGILKSITAGADWFDINQGLQPYSAALDYRFLQFDLATPDALLLTAKYGLLRTTDGGATWMSIPLITPPGSTEIYATAINPKNSLEIYYSTTSTFYNTTDGGKNWVTKRLPTSATATYMTVDPENEAVVYMGMSNLSKK